MYRIEQGLQDAGLNEVIIHKLMDSHKISFMNRDNVISIFYSDIVKPIVKIPYRTKLSDADFIKVVKLTY